MTLPLGLWQWLAAAAVTLAGTILQGSIGFGVALLGAPLLYLVEPWLVPGPILIVGLAVPLLVALREWRAVDTREIGRMVPGMAVGVAAAGVVVRAVGADTLGLLFGALVLLAVGLSLRRQPPVPGRATLLAAGGLAGFMATATSICGPVLALAFQDRGGSRLRGSLSACLIPIGGFALLALAWAGRLGAREWLAGVSLLPAVLLGFFVSAATARMLDRQWLRTAVLAVSALAAMLAIVRALV